MIFSENRSRPLHEFHNLMDHTDIILNDKAKRNEAYFTGRNGTALETDVFQALKEAAVSTPFANTIKLVSGASFPDIVADGYYGVEVKSTKSDSWRSIGSSILESTRIQGVERIFLTFGKLGSPVRFMSRPYEECLSGISVTHYPRYQIDMLLKEGNTIFDKIGIPYDELRKMDEPVGPVAAYYKSKLKPGESLWWAAEGSPEETVAPPTVRLWTALNAEEKNIHTARAYALYPEILGSSQTKYQRLALWLVTSHGIVNTNIRDQFSAGGRVDITIADQHYNNLPGAFSRIVDYREIIAHTILKASEAQLMESWEVSQIKDDRISQWIDLVNGICGSGKCNIRGLLTSVFAQSKPYSLSETRMHNLYEFSSQPYWTYTRNS